MPIMKWEPFNEIEKFFNDRTFSPLPIFQKLGWDFAVDLYEEKNNVVAKMSLPGIKPEDVAVSVEGDLLTISGRRDEEKEVDKKDYHGKEIRRGSFSRTVNLPRPVDAEKAEAKYEDGMLVVTLPALPGSKEKAVKIKVGK